MAWFRDAKQWVAVAKEAGIKFCFYHSIMASRSGLVGSRSDCLKKTTVADSGGQAGDGTGREIA